MGCTKGQTIAAFEIDHSPWRAHLLISPFNLIRLLSYFFSTNIFLPGRHFGTNAALWNIRFIDPASHTQRHQAASGRL